MASIYHPPDPIYDAAELLDFLSDTCDQILLEDPNAKIIIAGHINQLNIGECMREHGFEQMVKVPTTGSRILNVFLTNSPLLKKQATVHPALVRSDHLVVTVSPLVPTKPSRKHVFFRDTRDHRKMAMDSKLMECDLNFAEIFNAPEKCVRPFNDKLSTLKYHQETYPLCPH